MNDGHDECAVVEATLLEYFEGTLGDEASARLEAHAAACLPCGSLIRDVNGIRNDAASLTELSPPRDLWAGIDSRIQPRVVSIGAARAHSGMSRKWLAAAAVLLVASTSTVTYLATSRSLGEGAASPAAAAAAADAAPTQVAADFVPARVQANLRPAGTLASGGNPTAAVAITELPYDGEIRRLQSALVERRTQLDPATVSIVEENLKLIDTAVRQARAALSRDPASGFLSGKLNSALEKKIELLRTAALLPSRT